VGKRPEEEEVPRPSGEREKNTPLKTRKIGRFPREEKPEGTVTKKKNLWGEQGGAVGKEEEGGGGSVAGSASADGGYQGDENHQVLRQGTAKKAEEGKRGY